VPYSYTIDSEAHFVLVEYHGRLSVDEMLRFREEVSRDPAFDPTLNVIHDFRGVTQTDLSADDIQTLSRRTVFAESVRYGVVVNTQHQHALVRMYDGYRRYRPGHLSIFRDMGEALAWIRRGAG